MAAIKVKFSESDSEEFRVSFHEFLKETLEGCKEIARMARRLGKTDEEILEQFVDVGISVGQKPTPGFVTGTTWNLHDLPRAVMRVALEEVAEEDVDTFDPPTEWQPGT